MLIYIYKIWAEFETYKIRSKIQMEKIMNKLIKLESSVDIWFKNNLLITFLSDTPLLKDFKTISFVISSLKPSNDSMVKFTTVAFAFGNFPL